MLKLEPRSTHSQSSSEIEEDLQARLPKAWRNIALSDAYDIYDELAQHWSHLPPEGPSPNLSWQELACNGTNTVYCVPELPEAFEKLRSLMGNKPMVINSAYRSPTFNARIGGAKRSQHMHGKALDISVANHDPHAFVEAAIEAGFGGIGTYPNSNFIHVDLRPLRDGKPVRWGARFPAREGPFDGGDAERGVEIDRDLARTAGGAVIATGTATAGSEVNPTESPLETLERGADAWDVVLRFGEYAQYAVAFLALYAFYLYHRVLWDGFLRVIRRFRRKPAG